MSIIHEIKDDAEQQVCCDVPSREQTRKLNHNRVGLLLASKTRFSYDRFNMEETPNLDDDPQLSLLIKIFVKYLKLRATHQNENVRQVFGFIVGVIISKSYERNKSFQVEALWDIVAKAYPDKGSLQLIVQENYGETIALQIFRNDGCFYASYFGEFLFYCSTEPPEGSLVTEIRKSLTEDEGKFVDDIAATITPELGLRIFIEFRNWASDDGYPFGDWLEREIPSFDLTHKYYADSVSLRSILAKIEDYQELEDILKLFLSFLSWEGCSNHFYTELTTSISQLIPSITNYEDNNVEDSASDSCFIRLLQFFANMLWHFDSYSKNDDSLSVKEIFSPENFEKYFVELSAQARSLPIELLLCYLSEFMQILDFQLFQNWESGFAIEYRSICKSIGNIFYKDLGTGYAPATLKIEQMCLLPFLKEHE